MSFDYKWSLRNLEYGTEEYNTIIKKVRGDSYLDQREAPIIINAIYTIS